MKIDLQAHELDLLDGLGGKGSKHGSTQAKANAP